MPDEVEVAVVLPVGAQLPPTKEIDVHAFCVEGKTNLGAQRKEALESAQGIGVHNHGLGPQSTLLHMHSAPPGPTCEASQHEFYPAVNKPVGLSTQSTGPELWDPTFAARLAEGRRLLTYGGPLSNMERYDAIALRFAEAYASSEPPLSAEQVIALLAESLDHFGIVLHLRTDF
jgi:hypothetical protein